MRVGVALSFALKTLRFYMKNNYFFFYYHAFMADQITFFIMILTGASRTCLYKPSDKLF